MKRLNNSVCRPRDALAAIARKYPNAWKQVDEFRASRGKDIDQWPDWCFLPLAGAYAIVSNGGLHELELHKVGDVSRLGALAAWRVTQGIYRFDPAVYEAVQNTAIERNIPCDVLYHMPEWCIYIETPNLTYLQEKLHGVWVHLEWDANDGRHELRMLTDTDEGEFPIILHLGQWELKEAIRRAFSESERNGFPVNANHWLDSMPELVALYEKLLSLVLYICSQTSQIGTGNKAPINPVPKRIKGGQCRLFPPDRITTWDVGVRMGSALRKANQVSESGQGNDNNAPRGHIRRAHWHGFRSGPMKREDGTEILTSDRDFKLRWLPPIGVNLEEGADLPATIRPVKW